MNRIIYALSLLGIVLITHFYLQIGKGFSNGCWGVSSAPTPQTESCIQAITSDWSHVLGVSNVIWALAFYILIGALTLGILISNEKTKKAIIWIRTGLLSIAVLYSIYLTYIQLTTFKTPCSLCLTSFVLILLMFAAQLWAITRKKVSKQDLSQLTAYFLLISFIGGSLLLADLVILNQVGMPSKSKSLQYEVSQMVSMALTENISEEWLLKMAPCKIDVNTPPVLADLAKELNIPVLGNPKAPVTIMEIFDPNCPHCKHGYPILRKLQKSNPNLIKLVMVPVPLWEQSIPQLQALFLAQKSGKFYEMLDLQMLYQGQPPVPNTVLGLFAHKLGMDPKAFSAALESGAEKERAVSNQQLLAKLQLRGVPAIYVNGNPVNLRGLNEDCLTRIAKEIAGTPTATE